ncbi:MAG: hypothetical protein HYW69_01855 [Candidatus Nealsonbacteria bacterium]|nr:hypothetical protein [Candidatus Nealsonbacteria bacterium]
MELSEIVRFIYNALSVVGPWNDAVISSITVPELTSDGFQIVSSDHSVGMKEFRGTIFVSVHEPTVNYSSMARDQKRARTIYEQMVNALLAA